MTDDTPVLYETHEAVAVVTIARPTTRNALTTEVLGAIAAAYDRAEADSDVRALVLTGGPVTFASGADVRELRDVNPASYLVSERQAAWARFARFGKPTVAAVAGFVLGGGCELALSCDVVIAADTAVFGQPEVRLGLIPGAGGTQRWARAAGRYRAADIVLHATTLDAWTAAACGVVTEVVPAERLLAAAVDYAQTVASFAPVAVRLARQAVRAAEELPVSAALAHEKSLLATALATDDHREGIDAFLAKRSPRFAGR
jgi:enoyl-CoA hydratase/carnithine racemase